MANNIEVVALSPAEMTGAQEHLVAWCERRLGEVAHEVADAKERLRVTANTPLHTDAFQRQVNAGARRLEFYHKLLAALQAGYLIVPNFPLDVFAIRTTRVNPSEHLDRWASEVRDQPAMALPVGAGRYVAPDTTIGKRQVERFNPEKKDMEKVAEYYALDFRELNFPARLAHPRVLDATQRALALKVFDELGLVGEPTTDPVVVGRIYHPRSGGSTRRFTTFFIAWWLNTAAL
jgi:hypothetical protein